MEMQQRIDALIRMRREKPEHKHHWEHLQRALIDEPNLLTHAQVEELKSEFNAIRQKELLNFWDEQFHEVVITGERSDYYTTLETPKPTVSRSSLGQYADTASLTLGKSTMTETELAQVKQMLASQMNASQREVRANASAKQKAY